MDESSQPHRAPAELPPILFSLAGLVFVAAHLHGACVDWRLGRAQLEVLQSRHESTRVTLVQAEESLKQREVQIQNGSANEAKYASIFNDLLELAKSDADARQLTLKWKIQREGEATQEAPATSAAAAQPPSENRLSKPGIKPAADTPAPGKTR